MANLSWRYLGHIERRLAELLAEAPTATVPELTEILNNEFESDPMLDGQKLTASMISKKRPAALVASRAIARSYDSAVTLADDVERNAAPTVPGNYVPRTVAITEVERDEDSGSTRRVSTTYSLRKLPEVPQAIEVEKWDNGKLADAVRHERGERLVAIAGDTQFPHEDPRSWAAFLAWVKDVQPEEIILSGDIVDFGKAGRHSIKLDRELVGGLNADLKYAYTRLWELRCAAGNSRIQYVRGNHDDNVERTLLRLGGLSADLSTLRPAGDENETPLLSLRRMLRLDELGIEISETPWPYDRAILADDLVVFHGESARKGSGQSVKALMAKYPMASTVQGHCHRQAIVSEGVHGIDGSYSIRYGIETGALCKTDGLGYTTAPDWTQGWVVISFPEEGPRWTPEQITVHDGGVRWRGRSWHVEIEEAA
jgi:predicted phosphodiesterase